MNDRDVSLRLPDLASSGTKHERGRALIVGGSRETPGAVLLAAHAALRAGAGLVQIATASSAATAIAVAMPEVRVVALQEIEATGAVVDAGRVRDLAGGVDAVLVGSGTFDPKATRSLVVGGVTGLGPGAVLVVDAAALDVIGPEPDLVADVVERVVLMPNPNEAARLGDRSTDAVTAD